ncbi:MAG: M23 family metallopeptidase [Gammaproteobacteria bacterium]|nr:M23 family metallopeptidase [Gammaproteobacteria bacterium]
MSIRMILLALCVSVVTASVAQTLYRYKDSDGNWQFSDRPPVDKRSVESERMITRNRVPEVTIIQEEFDAGTRLVAINEWHCPMELVVDLTAMDNLQPQLGSRHTAVLQPDSKTELLDILPADPGQAYGFEMKYRIMPGDPSQAPDTSYLYEMPFARGTKHPVSQAFPARITHTDEGSHHAIDLAMDVGTPIHAARGGVVFATSYEHYSGGTDAERDLPKANVVRIAHDDGTMAVYAHLAWNAIRVRPGQRVNRGQYIADSGNTGFSSGPHLHFAVLANRGMQLTSIPVTFSGQGNRPVQPQTGQVLLNIE